jgi:hypothetical protein
LRLGVFHQVKTVTELEQRIGRSAERLHALIGPLKAPRTIVDSELRLLIRDAARLIGPDRIRRWMDELVNYELAALSDPKVPCAHCRGLGMLFHKIQDTQCPECCGLGAV